MIKEIDGVKIHYETSGDSGSRILLLHGWGCSIQLMKPVADRITGNHRFMIIDFPGHGESSRPPEPWGVPEYSECLLRFLRETGFYPCHIIAHSFGARIAAWIASTHPEMVNRIILTGAAGIRPKQTEAARKRSAQYQKLKRINAFAAKVPLLHGVSLRLEEKLRRKYGSRDYNSLDAEMRKTFVRIVSQDLTDLYGSFRSGTLLLWGDRDTETPLWMGREMEKRIPDSSLIILEGGTHFAYLEQVDRFCAIASEFLKED